VTIANARHRGDGNAVTNGPQLTLVEQGHAVVVCARGELDLAVKEQLSKFLAPLSGVVIVDLSEVTFLDSSAMAAFIRARKTLVADGGDLRLRNPHPLPRRALEVVGLASLIES